jgi:hypothetical protein
MRIPFTLKRTARKIPGVLKFKRALEKLLGRETGPNPDGMKARSLVKSIEDFRLEDTPVGSGVRLSPDLRDRVVSRFSKRAEEFFRELGLPVEGVSSDVQEFFESPIPRVMIEGAQQATEETCGSTFLQPNWSREQSSKAEFGWEDLSIPFERLLPPRLCTPSTLTSVD